MPEVQEVFRMATQKVRPDPGFADRQYDHRRKQERSSKLAAFAMAAAIGVAAIVLVLVNRPGQEATTPGAEAPTVNPAEPEAGPVGTVTFDGSTCSMEITADRIEPGPLGFVPFRVVNATEKRVMFDSWRLLDGYTVRAFEATIERDRRLAEKPGNQGVFPDQEREVSYLGSDVIPANSSDIIVPQMSTPGHYAIVCLQPFEGDFRPFGVVGPIVVR
jgi:hypothetical protein